MESILGEGTFGEVHKALDSQTNKKVAIKIFDNLDETLPEIEEDYAVISTHWIHPNIPHFMGLFLQVRMAAYCVDIISEGVIINNYLVITHCNSNTRVRNRRRPWNKMINSMY